MKKFFVVLVILFVYGNMNAQYFPPQGDEMLLTGGMGLTWIDGEPYYSVHFYPEFSLGNFGVGLDLNLEINRKGQLRKENFNEFTDFMSIIRYVRYGQKNDPFYARLGALDYATLGYGTVMYLYNNRISYDAKKVGTELDMEFNAFGFETVYSSFGQAGILGFRGYVKPLQFTSVADVPIIGSMEIGATVAADLHEHAGVIDGALDGEGNFVASEDEGAITIMGFDLGFPLLRASVVDMDTYVSWNKIFGFGDGAAVGMSFDFKLTENLTAKSRFERRFNGSEYIPSYFNAFYELERFNFDEATGVQSKAKDLKFNAYSGNSYYGELTISAMGLLKIVGSFQKYDKYSNSGVLSFYSEIAPEDASFLARAGYNKKQIEDLKDMFTTDERSYLFAEIGYKPMPYLLVSILYSWTYSPVRDADDNILSYEPQKKIEPRLSFIIPIGL